VGLGMGRELHRGMRCSERGCDSNSDGVMEGIPRVSVGRYLISSIFLHKAKGPSPKGPRLKTHSEPFVTIPSQNRWFTKLQPQPFWGTRNAVRMDVPGLGRDRETGLLPSIGL
jgi:hypothetical protein